MVGESYIVYEPSNRNRLYGKNINPDTTMANSGLSEYQIQKMNKYRIRNLVMYDDQRLEGDQLDCSLCRQRRTPMTKHELLHMNDDIHTDAAQRFTERIERECQDNIAYAMCFHCGNIATEPKSELLPVRAGPFQCVKCQFTPENGGKVKTLRAVQMYQNPSDENKPQGWGDEQKSKKLWYWVCSLCGWRELMLKSNLKRKFVQQQDRSFVKSLESSLDKRTKKLMNREDVEDLQAGLGWTPTSLVDSRDITPEYY